MPYQGAEFEINPYVITVICGFFRNSVLKSPEGISIAGR